MPRFAYIAVDPTGATVEGARKGETIGDVRSWLRHQELHPVKIEEKQRKLLDFELTAEKLKKRELMHFSRQLAVFIKAGIPIITALETIADEAEDKVLRRVIAGMVERLGQGQTFADACAAHPEAFPEYYVGVLRSAELTGRLDDTVDELAQHLDREIEARQRVISALVYPLIVMAMAIVTVIILAFIVLPQFKTFFDELDADLPLSTRILLGFTRLWTDLWFIPVALMVALAVFVVWMFRTESGRVRRDSWVFKIPAIGGIVQYSILERFCRIMATMTSAGVSVPDALAVTAQATNNRVYQTRLEGARQKMVRGDGLARPLIETELFPGAAKQMITVGEESGTLDEQLQNSAIYFDRELDVRIKRFTNAFEPATIIFVGVIVGFVAVALVQAMYGMLGGLRE